MFCPQSGFIDVRIVPGFSPHAPHNSGPYPELSEAAKSAFADRLISEARRFHAAEDLAGCGLNGLVSGRIPEQIPDYTGIAKKLARSGTAPAERPDAGSGVIRRLPRQRTA